jgi:hypothetical protein
MSIRKPNVPVLIVALLVSLLLGKVLVVRFGAWRSSPRSLEEVLAIAQKHGLYCCGDQAAGSIGRRLIISESPLSWERANAFRIGHSVDRDWKGTVAVVRDMDGMQTIPDENIKVWGEFFLYGDPSLIERLTATVGTAAAPGPRHPAHPGHAVAQIGAPDRLTTKRILSP